MVWTTRDSVGSSAYTTRSVTNWRLLGNNGDYITNNGDYIGVRFNDTNERDVITDWSGRTPPSTARNGRTPPSSTWSQRAGETTTRSTR